MQPSPAEMAVYVEQSRYLRACAIENGLDPEKALPEDILLLSRDKESGELECYKELQRAVKWLELENKKGNNDA